MAVSQSSTCALLEDSGCNCTGCACGNSAEIAELFGYIPTVPAVVAASSIGVVVIVVAVAFFLLNRKLQQASLELKDHQARATVIPQNSISSSPKDHKISNMSNLHTDLGGALVLVQARALSLSRTHTRTSLYLSTICPT